MTDATNKPLAREPVARVIAAELSKQDYYPDARPEDMFNDASLTWPYIDQGHVDFGLIADAILALAAPAEVVGLKEIRALCGYVEDGSSCTFKLSQDDATKNWTASSGSRWEWGQSPQEAIQKLIAACLPAAPTGETGA